MVVDLSTERADRVFHALADATRRDIVLRTLEGEHNVSALARLYPRLRRGHESTRGAREAGS